MKELFDLIYKEILTHDTYDVTNDDKYQRVQNNLTMIEETISNILYQSVPKQVAHQLREDYDMALNELLYLYEFRDFQFYFSAGLAIGLTVNDEDLESFKELALKIRNSL